MVTKAGNSAWPDDADLKERVKRTVWSYKTTVHVSKASQGGYGKISG